MTTSLALREDAPLTIQDVMTLADAFVRSGYFKDASDPAKAVVKIMYGRDLGIGAMAAMNGVQIIEGKPSLSAGLVGALIMRSGKYVYRVRKCDATGATLEFFERDNGAWSSVGMATFDTNDAKAAGLAGKPNWNRYGSDMMFARALTRGARRYCPDVFLGPVYTSEELGADFAPETAEVIAELPETIAQTITNGTVEAYAAVVADVIEVEDRLGIRMETPSAPETHSANGHEPTPADATWPPAPEHWNVAIDAAENGKAVFQIVKWLRAVETNGPRRLNALAHAYHAMINHVEDVPGLRLMTDMVNADRELSAGKRQLLLAHIEERRAMVEAWPEEDQGDQPSEIELVGDGAEAVPE